MYFHSRTKKIHSFSALTVLEGLPYPRYGTKFLNSFFPFISKLWNSLPSSTQAKNLVDFKTQLKIETKPDKIKHYAKGPKLSNTLITRFRVGRTYLNLHRYTIGHVDTPDTPDCLCHAKQKSSLGKLSNLKSGNIRQGLDT